MAIEIVDFPIENGDFPVRYVKLPEGTAAFAIENFECPALSSKLGISWYSWGFDDAGLGEKNEVQAPVPWWVQCHSRLPLSVAFEQRRSADISQHYVI